MAEFNVVEESDKDKKEIKPVAKAKKRKKSIFGMFKDSFIADEIGDLKEYIVKDVVVPMIQDAIVDGITSSLSMMFYGDKMEAKRYSRSRDRYDYARPYSYVKNKKKQSDWRDNDDRKYGKPRVFEPVECEYKQEALDILSEANEIINRNGELTVAGLYDLATLSSTPEDENFGWKTLEGVRIIHTRDNTYIIEMPRPRCLV